MKLSMETIYFPEASFTQRKEMMEDWRATSDKAAKLSFFAAATSLLVVFFLLGFKEDYSYIYCASAFTFLVAGFACKKWYFSGYIAVFAGVFISCLRFYFQVPDRGYILAAIVVQALISFVPAYFAFRCAYNHGTVFKKLRECKGFPNFIANTADLYGDKIYLHDEESTVYEGRTEVSYSPFSSKEEIKADEVRRQQDATVKAQKGPIRLDLAADGELRPPEKKLTDKEKYKYGKAIFGREIVFYHNDIEKASFEEKKDWMSKWRDNIELASNNFPTFVLLIMVAVMASGFGTVMGILNHAVVLVFIMGINQMKMGKAYAPVPLVIATIYTFSISITNVISFMCVVGAFLFNFGVVIGFVRYILNYKIYKRLSQCEGFPSFIRSTADLYADQLYIVEKPAPRKKADPSQRKVKVMDIGYDTKPKEDEGAWNAFDYMDKKDDKENES